MNAKRKKLKETWLGEWKTNNESTWRLVIYRLGFPQNFLVEYTGKEEMDDFVQALEGHKIRIKEAQTKAGQGGHWNSWQHRAAICDMFRTFRKIIRRRHLMGFQEKSLYHAASKIYAQQSSTKWSNRQWCAIKKESVLLFAGYSETGDPEFFTTNNMVVSVNGSQLDKIRKVESQEGR